MNMSIIKPHDVLEYGTDSLRDVWTIGRMRHVVAACEGLPVAVEVDKMTGCTVAGRLVDVFDGGPSRGGRLTVQTEHGRTHYYLPSVGVLVVLEDHKVKGAKWRAGESLREEIRAATDHAREHLGAQRWYVKWGASVTADGVYVTTDPGPRDRAIPPDAERGRRWGGLYRNGVLEHEEDFS